MSRVGLAPAVSPPRWAALTAGSVALAEAGLVWRFGATAALPAFCYFGAVLTLAAVLDARTLKIPNLLLLPSYPVGVALLATAAAVEGRWWSLGRALVALAAVAGLYLAVALVAGGRRMGLADVTLGGLLGLLLGWVSWSALATGVLLGWAVALLAVLVWRPGRRLQDTTRHDRTTAIPAGPCLWLGALVAVLLTR